jgi:protoporphyrinogen oxidase
MNIAIVGAGFTGLSAAFQLVKQGHTVALFEKEAKPGGLASGYKKKNWNWTLEQHYHHWFTNDDAVLSLAREIGYPVLTRRPKTSVYVSHASYQLDSPFHVLTFPRLSVVDRLRMAASLGFLKLNPFWKSLEKYSTEEIMRKTMGAHAYDLLWKPQLHNKFGSYAQDISLAWFWARINKRTSALSYPEKGYLSFLEALVTAVSQKKGKVLFSTAITAIQEKDKKVLVSYTKGKKVSTEQFDRVIVTVDAFLFAKLVSGLPDSYTRSLTKLQSLGAVDIVLRFKKEFLQDGTYWLSICDMKAPFVALVEHTNFMDKKHFDNEHLVYAGNYLSPEDKIYNLSPDDLLKYYDPYLKKINPSYKKNLIGYDVFKAPFAQPIVPINYSKMLPPMKTPLKNVYLANMQQVYPWDRGTNYAVELGEKVANAIMKYGNRLSVISDRII